MSKLSDALMPAARVGDRDNPGGPEHGPVAPIEPVPGTVEVTAATTPSLTPEEATWDETSQKHRGVVRSILKRLDGIGILLARSGKNDRESKIARSLEPTTVLISNPIMAPVAVSAGPGIESVTVCGERKDRRDVIIGVGRLPASVVLYIVKARTRTSTDNAGTQPGFQVPSTGITLRTKEAIFGYVAGSGTVAGASAVNYVIDVIEEIY